MFNTKIYFKNLVLQRVQIEITSAAVASSIEKHTFKSTLKIQIEIISLNKLPVHQESQFTTPHRTNFYHLFLFENATLTHRVDTNPITITPYTLLAIGKDRIHQFDDVHKYKGYLLVFTEDFFIITEKDKHFLQSMILFNDLQNVHHFPIDKLLYGYFKTQCCEIQKELKQPDSETKSIILKNILHNLLLVADREKSKLESPSSIQNIDSEYTLSFHHLIEKTFTTHKPIQYYSNKLCLSEKRLRRATEKISGKSPKELIQERIILEAKRLLVYTNLSSKEISYQLGFESPTYFVRCFKKVTMMTPVAFREKHSHS